MLGLNFMTEDSVTPSFEKTSAVKLFNGVYIVSSKNIWIKWEYYHHQNFVAVSTPAPKLIDFYKDDIRLYV